MVLSVSAVHDFHIPKYPGESVPQTNQWLQIWAEEGESIKHEEHILGFL